MDLMKENLPVSTDATQKLQDANGLDLLLKAAAAQQASAPNETDGMKKTKKPLIPLHGAYNASVIVGRGSQATLNLGRINRQVSRRHAVVQWNESVGSFQITVLGQNGVRINGAGYPSGEETRLKDGDIVDLVGVKMVFCSPKSSDGLESSSVQSLGLETPTRTPKSVRQLATPTFSSPLDDDKRSPSAHHAFSRKYDHRYNSPPLSSDAGTEFGSSPVKSRQIFTLSNEDSPVRRPLGLESPRSDDNIFLDDYPLRTPTKSSSQRSPLAPLPLNGAKSNVSKTQPAIVRTGSESQATTTITSAKPSKKSTAPTKPAVVDKNTKQKATPSVKEKEHEGKASVASPKKEKSKTTKDSHPVVTKSPKVKDVHPSTTESTKAKESQQQPSTTTKTAKTAAPKTLAAPPVAVKELSHTSKTSKDTNKTGQIIKDSEKKSKVDTDDHSHSDDDEEDGPLSSSEESSPEEETSGKKSTMDYTEMIIDTLVFARKKKSMTLSELFDEMIASQPSLMATQTSEEIKEQMIKCLSAARCVGKITRKGKDANNKPLENQWYYIPEYDYNTMRKQTRQEVMPSARACTLKDKQYFFKMPPKLPYHRKSASPYLVKSSSVRPIKESSKLSTNADVEDDEEVSSSSSSSESEGDVDDHLQTKRKRSAVVSGHLDKKRKAQPTSSTAVDGTTGKRVEKEEEEEEEDDDDGTQNDSLDDLSDISGLSD